MNTRRRGVCMPRVCGGRPKIAAARLWLFLCGGSLGQGDSDAAPQLRYKRVVLAEQAIAADAKADWVAGYLARGDALTSDDLATLVSQLEPLPEAAETVAA